MPRTRTRTRQYRPLQREPYQQRRSIIDAWYALLNADAQCPLNVRVDITLKQRRDCDSEVSVWVRAPDAPTHALRTVVQRTTAFAPSLPSTVLCEANVLDPVYPHRVLRKVKKFRKCQPPISVRPKRSARSPRYSADHAPAYYLTEDEARRIAIRVVNRLNKAIFGKAANRKQNPTRLTALICQHDRETRRHLHALFAVPPSVPIEQFTQLLRKAMQPEPFIARIHEITKINVGIAASIAYNLRDDKTISDNSVLYVYSPQSQPPLTTQEEAHDPERTDRPDRDRRFSPVAA